MPGLIAAARWCVRRPTSRFVNIFLRTVRGFATAIRDAEQRSSQRRVLREWIEYDQQHLLRDIGLTREQARREAAKWFWQR
jgi:uncharacterized protein YjiS (DUF1127 family)